MRLGARVGRLAGGLLAVALFAFALPALLPGATEASFLGPRTADPIARAELRHDLHLSAPLPVQFLHFVGDAIGGDLGRSPVSGVDVGTVVGERLLASVALAAAAVALAFGFAFPGRRRRRVGDAPAPGAVPSAAWILPLFAAVAVASRFGAVPTVDVHAAIGSRCAAALLPALTLALALAAWIRVARRTARDLLAAVLVGTLVTEAVFALPGLGSLIVTAATRPDPLLLRGAVLAIGAIAVVAGVAFVPAGGIADSPLDGPSMSRRAASGLLASAWLVAVVVTTIGRLQLGLPLAARIGTQTGAGVSAAHPFGTDAFGRDVLARVLATARGSLLLLVAAGLAAVVIGSAIGVVIGFAGGRLERLGIAALALWVVFPGEIVAVALLAFGGRGGSRAAIALAFVVAPGIAAGVRRRTDDGLRRTDARLSSGALLRAVAANASLGIVPVTLATMFVGAARILMAELVAGFLGVGPAATQTWSHEIVTQFSFASRAPLAVLAPASVALLTAVALAALGNAIRPARAETGSAAGESEDALGEDVLVHLGGPAGDGERA